MKKKFNQRLPSRAVAGKSFNDPLPQRTDILTKNAREEQRRQRLRELFRPRPGWSFSAVVCAIICFISTLSVGLAFFSDMVNDSVVSSSGCLQATPTLKIDGAVGDWRTSDWQSAATCIPARYTQVEYLAFSGTQYIDTGVNQLGDTKATAKFALNNAAAAYPNGHIFGARAAANNSSFAFIANNGGNFTAYWGTTSNQLVAAKDTNVHTATLDNNKVYLDGVLKLTISGTAPSVASNIYLAGFSSANAVIDTYQLSGKIYNFQISKSGALVRDMIPVFDGQTGMCGMYDLVSKTVFGNKGAGAIDCPGPKMNANCDNLPCNGQDQGGTAVVIQPNTVHNFSYTLTNTGTVEYQNYTGDKISAWLSSRYAPTEYLQFDGASYIDSGIDQVDSTQIAVDFQYTNIKNSSGYGILFGTRDAGSKNKFFFNYNSDANFLWQHNTTSANLGVKSLNRCQLSIDTGASPKKGSITGCGTPANNTQTGNITANPLPMYIGGLNSGGSFETGQGFVGKIYSFSIAKADVAKRDYVPAYDTVTGRCGLYDNVTNVFFDNKGTGTISCPAAAANPLKVLLYPNNILDSTINAELAAMTSGTAATSPSALATVNGSACSGTFYGSDTGISPVCTTAALAGTLGAATYANSDKTYNYKFVIWAPASMDNIYGNTKIYLGVSSGAQGITATNWKQQMHPFVNAQMPAFTP